MNVTIEKTQFECYLIDDGTLDTVIEVDGIEHRFDGEFANQYRDKNGTMTKKGFIELCKECIEEYEEHWK